MDTAPAVFFSYARADDASEGGRLTQIRKSLETELRTLSAEPWEVFQDIEDIAIGQQWRKRLAEGLGGSTFFVPVLTPTYFKRLTCRDELSQFLVREAKLGRDDLVIPLLYLKTPGLADTPAGDQDPLKIQISARQIDDWRQLRHHGIKSARVKARVTRLAEAIISAHGRGNPGLRVTSPSLPVEIPSVSPGPESTSRAAPLIEKASDPEPQKLEVIREPEPLSEAVTEGSPPGAGKRIRLAGMILAALAIACLVVIVQVRLAAFFSPHPKASEVPDERKLRDEAKIAGRTPSDFKQIPRDLFAPMDNGTPLASEEIAGRNTWMLWTAGNEHFWDWAAQNSFGSMDLLRVLDNRAIKRGERFKLLGLLNQPGLKAPEGPDEFGLWLDVQSDLELYPSEEKIYGKPTGVIGFRLFPNPEFNAAAQMKWNAERFLNDPTYYNDNKLVRPYRIGITCAACHTGFNPSVPPIDAEAPAWQNLSSAIGNQYLREGRIFASRSQPGGFLYEQLRTQPPGTSDTSRIATDHIDNATAINAIALVGERERLQVPEKLAGGNLALPGVSANMPVSHLLYDGADSIGLPGAIMRFYVNIGMFSEYWVERHNPLVGLLPQKVFEISYARENSIYWQATEERTENVIQFLRRLQPARLPDVPNGAAFLSKDEDLLARGRQAFAQSCAYCHSSKQPPPEVDPQSAEGRNWFREMVNRPDFFTDNYLSNDRRIPITEVKTNSARAFEPNALRGHIWDNFSSETFKSLPPPEEMNLYNPFKESQPIHFRPKDKNTGGGYYRVPSLSGLWSSAPVFHNNSLGAYTGDPSIAGRMTAFNDAAERLLWPEKRLGKESIKRTQSEVYLRIHQSFVPEPVRTLADHLHYVNIGPIPEGAPIKLFANLEADFSQVVQLNLKLEEVLRHIRKFNLNPHDASIALVEAVPELLAANKCPDFIEDKGHYYGTELSDDDKRALIEFLKTL